MAAEIYYIQPQPGQWDELVSAASRFLPVEADRQRPFSYEAISRLAEFADNKLDVEELDTVLYHGLGKGMIGMEKVLRDPFQRSRVVGELHGHFLEHHPLQLGSLLRGQTSGDMSALIAGAETFTPLAKASMEALPAPEHLVADTLASLTRARRETGLPNVSGQLHEGHVRSIQRGAAAASLIGINSIAAPIEILRRAAAAYPPDTAPPRNLPSQLTWSQLKNLTRVATKAASLHVEEFNNPAFLDKLIQAGEEPFTLQIDDSQIPESPQLPSDEQRVSPIQHEQRVGCPLGRRAIFRHMLEIVWEAAQPMASDR